MSFFSKLKSPFSSKIKVSSIDDQDQIEAIIKDIEHEPFAISEANVLFAGLNELGGYFFMQTVVVGRFKTKVKQGATLQISGHDIDLKLDSDMLEIESDHTNIKGRFITKIDFQIDESEVSNIDRSKINSLILSCKKEKLSFSIYELNKSE